MLSSPCMKLITLIIATAIAANAFGQDVVNISIPKGGSWLLTGGGPGQDDAPAPFLPATAIIQNYSEDATVRIMNSGNSKQLRTYPLSAEATTRFIVNPGERLLIDSELARNQISVSYDLPLLPIIIRNESTSHMDVELSNGRRFNSPANQDISLKVQPGTSVKINNVEVARVFDYCSGQGQVIKTKFQ